MKVLIINSEYPPVGAGAGNASANLARRLVALGHEVVVITAGYDGLATDEQLQGVRILRGPSSRKHVDRSTALEQVIFILGAAIRSLGLYRAVRPQVVLAFFGLPSGAVAWLLKGLFGTPYIVSLRGGDVPGFRPYDFWLYHRIAVPFLRIIWRGAAAVVANSGGLKNLAKAFDAKVDIEIVPNGVEADKYWSPQRAWNAPIILSVGRVVHQKGLDLAVAALGGLRDFAWEWRVVGDGPEIGRLKSALTQQGIDPRVKFLGWLDADRLVKEYQSAGIFMFPSRHEGMPNALLEAMASGLPAVASRVAGNEELVLPDETGLLIQADDAIALRDALRQMLVSNATRERMGRAAHQRVAERYSWEAAAQRYEELLEGAIQ